ncbi:glycosyltransferase family 4 protein [Pelagicoccus sp. SDUM812003]|uniref:glycosyltransferase family 4 protein n=1 Tax=Pelagicoccus sp. SDUM812003 TaxID=3041267 RepID=UPI00280DB96A|nr:glycosyltransferase family 4 protein [Pelagicoccus sp. SDUM812003]MDQ8205627.1 glycosyltransferase family 4 protein [Pelagicoccus sp. SDUM812003]
MIRSLTERGHDVVALAPECDSELTSRLRSRGARFIKLTINRAGLSPIGDLRYTIRLARILSNEKPDLLLSYNIKPVIFGSFAGRLAGVKHLATIVAGLGYAFSQPSSNKHRLVSSLTKLLYRNAISRHSLMIFQNNDDRTDLQKLKLLNPRTTTIVVGGSGVDTSWFTESTPSTTPVSFLLTARLISDKGIYEYYEAAKRILASGRKAQFQLLGPFDSNPKGITENVVKKWKAEGIIQYLGELDDVRPAYNNCSVFVLPSYYREGCPRSSLEALSCGRPIITTNSVGCRETVIDGKNGFLARPRSIEDIEQAMIRFIDDPSLIHRMGKASRKLAVERFDVHTVNRRIIEAIEALP